MPKAGPVGQRDMAVDDLHAVEAVVRDQQITVQVGPVHHRRELRGGRDGAGGFGHAADHRLHAECPSQNSHSIGFPQTGAFHQLDIDAVVDSLDALDVRKALQELVGDDRQRAPFAQPGRLVDHLLGQRLLDEQRIALGELTADRFERPLLIGPSLIGVDTERLVGRRADDLDELAVALDAHFDLDHVVGNRFLDFLPDDLGRVDADRERGARAPFRATDPISCTTVVRAACRPDRAAPDRPKPLAARLSGAARST